MCFTLRKTARRGRCSEPRTFCRMRSCIRRRTIFLESFAICEPELQARRPALLASSAGLADLFAQLFAGIPDALVLVRIGWSQRADIGCHLSDHLLVVAGED